MHVNALLAKTSRYARPLLSVSLCTQISRRMDILRGSLAPVVATPFEDATLRLIVTLGGCRSKEDVIKLADNAVASIGGNALGAWIHEIKVCLLGSLEGL